MTSSSDTKYIQQVSAALDRLYSESQHGSSWKVSKQSDGISIYNRTVTDPSTGKSRTVWSSESIVDTPPASLFLLIYNHSLHSAWSKAVEHYTLVKSLSPTIDITCCVSATGGGGLVSSREWLDVRAIERRDNEGKRAADGSNYVLGGLGIDTTDEYPVKPYKKGLARGYNWPGNGYVFNAVPGDDTKCRVVWVIDSDPRGWVPLSVVNLALSDVMYEWNVNIRKLVKDEKFKTFIDVTNPLV